MISSESERGELSLPELVGLHRLISDLHLNVVKPRVRSELAGSRRTRLWDDHVLEQYPRSKGYRAEGLIENLRFALKYEPVDLGAYKAIFQAVPKITIEQWVEQEPSGSYARRAWFLFELLTGQRLDAEDLPPGAYIDLLDSDLHVTGPTRKVRRQRINNNLLGTAAYCPLIRRTEDLDRVLKKDLAQQTRAVIEPVDPAVLARAVHYLFTKETKSSFAIEGETLCKDRTERFVRALKYANNFDASNKDEFVRLQNSIVDPRYAEQGWRTVQNFVGETLPDYSQYVHYICPKPTDVSELMAGWTAMIENLYEPASVHPVCAAALAAFGFVFIHPFIDGNGRIHRFLVHHGLAKTGFAPANMIFPVSAVMLRNMKAYDSVLKTFSEAIKPFIDWTFDPEQRLIVRNDTVDLYRYFDATAHAEYLFCCVEDTILHDLRDEVSFLAFFDQAIKATLEIVDMPDQRAALLVRLIHQNKGTLSKAKRPLFAELTDDEIQQIEFAIGGVRQ